LDRNSPRMGKVPNGWRLTGVSTIDTIFLRMLDGESALDRGRKFRFLDHTADLGILVYGRNLEELFGNAGEAFFDIITDLRRVREDTEKTIRVESSSLEDLMVNWLGELLYLHDVDGLLFKSFSIDELNDGKMKARARGEAFQEERHVIKTEIKAVTYHQLQVKEERGGWMARIIFDV
jgi:SHS2 domain-containing protein